jgi:hypothetical protein
MSSSQSITSTSIGTRSSSNSSPSLAISAYSFGFIIISVVFLFIIIGCCFSRWRPGALLATPWDTSEQLDGRGGRRRKLVPPVLWDTWLSRPLVSTEEDLGASQFEWLSIQVCTVPMFRCPSCLTIAFNSLYLCLSFMHATPGLHAHLQLPCPSQKNL